VLLLTTSATIGIVLLLAEALNTWQPTYESFDGTPGRLLAYVVVFIIVTLLQYHANRSVTNAFAQSKGQAEQLIALNRALSQEAEERKRAVAAQAQDHTLLRTVIDTIPDPIFVKDREGRYVRVNQQFLADLNFPDEAAVVGKHTADIYPSEHQIAMVDAEFQTILTGGTIINRIRTEESVATGGTVWVSVSKVPLRNAHGEIIGMVGISRDITQQKQIELTLRDEWKLLRTIIDNLPDQVSLKDAQRRHVLINRVAEQAFQAVYGLSAADIIGKTFTELTGEIQPTEDLLYAGEVPYLREEVHLRPNQPTETWLQVVAVPLRDDQGRVTGVVGINHDITELRKADAALERERNLLRTLIDAIPEAIYVKDVQCRLLTCNLRQAHLAGAASPDALVGLTDSDIFPERGNIYQKDDEWVLQTGLPVVNKEELIGEKIGQQRWHRTTKVPLRDKAGTIIGLVGIGIDITEQKHIENELLLLNEALEVRVHERTRLLEDANRELESFAYSVSHDLRAPLRSIDGFSQLLLDDYGSALNEEAKDYLQRIRVASQRMDRLIDGLLRLSRVMRSQPDIQSVNLSAIAAEIAADLSLAEPSRQVRWEIALDLVARGDAALLRVAMQNLLQNAWKFTRQRTPAVISLSSEVRNGQLWYAVKDNGAGFDMQYVGKLFGPFQRLHGVTEYEGTGIGLATVHRIVRRHGGDIRAEGAVEQGATFAFTLG
jgi:PAS domain S-box-containing protein